MSDFRAIATVTATLQRTLQSALQADVTGATVTTLRPIDGSSANLPATGANLFLYQISTNPHRANDDLPTRRGDGSAVARPAAAIELHYLMSFYGADGTLEPQRLLGSAMAFLHGQPQLVRSQIRDTVADPTRVFLKGSDLADQSDVVRLTQTHLTFDELSRLWSVLLQTQYVLSTTFKAATVLIEKPIVTHPAPPVLKLQLAAATLQRPTITAISSLAGAGAPITAGASIGIDGAALSGDTAFVEIDGAAATPTSVDDQRITLTLPAGLLAGPHALLVWQGRSPAPNAPARPAFASDLAAFVLQPLVTQTAGVSDIVIANVQGTGAALRSATVSIGVAPAIAQGQSATLELLGATGVAYVVRARPLAAAATTLVFDGVGMIAATYVARIRVDGAASAVTLDANGVPTAPKAVIP